MAGALFNLHQKGDTMHRIKEFLALASSCILRNACDGETDKDSCRNQSALYIILEQVILSRSFPKDTSDGGQL